MNLADYAPGCGLCGSLNHDDEGCTTPEDERAEYRVAYDDGTGPLLCEAVPMCAWHRVAKVWNEDAQEWECPEDVTEAVAS